VQTKDRPSFLLETIEFVNSCKNDDLRFRKLEAPLISEIELYEDNGVLSILNNFTNYNYYTNVNN